MTNSLNRRRASVGLRLVLQAAVRAALGFMVGAAHVAAVGAQSGAQAPLTSSDTPANSLATATEESDTFEVRQFVLDGVTSSHDRRALLDVLRPFQSKRATMLSLTQAAAAVEAEGRRRGRLYRVSLPAQDLTDGVVHFQVQPVTLRRLESADPAMLGADRLHRMLPTLVEGQSPDLRAVSRNVALVNENPVRHATLTFKSAVPDGGQGAPEDNRVDVVVQPDRGASPWIATAEVNNQGPSQPNPWRVQALLANGNLFDLGQILSVSFTTAPSAFKDVRQYGIFYTVPWYEQGVSFNVYGFRSTSRTGAVDGLITVSGVGQFIGFSMKQRILTLGPWTPSWTLALDDKRFDNSSSVQGQAIGSPVRSRPLSLGAALAWDGVATHASVAAQLVDNLPGGADNGDSAYQAVRGQAHRNWHALRLNTEGSGRLSWGDAWIVRGSAQFSNDALISGEQFGLGGADSIRALEPRQLNGDRGWSVSAEYWSREWRPGLRALGFVDAGRVYDTHAAGAPSPGAAAAGLGARWTINPYFSVSADWGHVVRGVGGVDGHGQRVYASFDFRVH